MPTKKSNGKVPTASRQNRSDFVTWANDSERTEVLRAVAAENIESYGVVQRANSDFRGYRNFKDIDANTSVRPGFTRGDYEFFRPDEALPKDQKDAILRCMRAYERNGLIKNVIDMMADFSTRGINLVHPNPKVEKFYRNWWQQVHGAERSERWINYLLRCGNTIVRRRTAKLPKKVKAAKVSTIVPPANFPLDEIPWSYSFVNPLSLEVLAEELAQFVGKPIYAIHLPLILRNKINNPKDDLERQLVNQIPAEIRAAIKNGEQYVVLDQNSISVTHYKKDDWLVWGYPLCYAILNDIMLYDKLKLTDLAACDNAISSVRLWRLGNIDAKIFPTKAGIKKLSDILTNSVGGGAFDLVWGPELEFQESNTQIYKFLGQEKYGPTMTAIYGGLGIPTALTGGNGSNGMNTSYISLKTLTERLEYVRNLLCQFWKQEIALVQRAMGFKIPADITFDRMTLSDETAEKQLLLGLVDRDIISAATVLERFDEIPDLEKRRMIREQKARMDGQLPEKAGPFHRTQISEQLKQGFIQQGMVTPSQVGLDLPKKKPGEKTLRETIREEKQNGGGTPDAPNPKGEPGQGRPKNKKDSSKRSTKTVKPSTKAAMCEIWAKAALDTISEISTPGILKHYKKANLRRLNSTQAAEFEDLKFGILCQFEPFEKVDRESVIAVIDSGLELSTDIQKSYAEMQAAYAAEFDKLPSVEDLRQIQILVYNNYRNENIHVEN